MARNSFEGQWPRHHEFGHQLLQFRGIAYRVCFRNEHPIL